MLLEQIQVSLKVPFFSKNLLPFSAGYVNEMLSDDPLGRMDERRIFGRHEEEVIFFF